MAEQPKTLNRSDRAGLKTIVAFVDPEIQRLVKMAAAESVSSVQKVAEDSLVAWLQNFYEERKKKPELALLAAAVKRSKARASREPAPEEASARRARV